MKYFRLEEEEDERKNEYPGDFVPEIKVVWASCAEGKVGREGNLQG